MKSFYGRRLPCPPATPFASERGRAMFAQSLASGGMNGFFTLIEQFRTQDEPSFCGLSTLCMVLNALAVDPGRVWKGPWRWFSESMLGCCKDISRVVSDGISFKELACVARCNGAEVAAFYATSHSLDDLREAVVRVTGPTEKGHRQEHLIVSYSRSVFGQSGDGHFSPIGGYHAESDQVLILDVARFKYPPHWVSLELLYTAMKSIDSTTNRSRGWMSMKSSCTRTPLYFVLNNGREHFQMLMDLLEEEFSCRCKAGSKEVVSEICDRLYTHLITSISTYDNIFGVNYIPPELSDSVSTLLSELRAHPLYKIVGSIQLVKNEEVPLIAEFVTILVLSVPSEHWVSGIDCDDFASLIHPSQYDSTIFLKNEINAIQEQLANILKFEPITEKQDDLCPNCHVSKISRASKATKSKPQ